MSETQCQRLNVKDSMSETPCQRLNVRDSMSETQCQRPNVRDSMSESDLLTWSCVFATPHTSVYNFILVYKGIVDLSCLVFHPWTAARPSVNADRLLTASLSRVVIFSIQVFGPGPNSCRPSPWNSWWCHNDGYSVRMRVADWI
jgi:hypothetical protein